MTIEELSAQIIACLETGDKDHEASHGWVDNICENVIFAIAEGAENPKSLAILTKTLLQTTANWERWYA